MLRPVFGTLRITRVASASELYRRVAWSSTVYGGAWLLWCGVVLGARGRLYEDARAVGRGALAWWQEAISVLEGPRQRSDSGVALWRQRQ